MWLLSHSGILGNEKVDEVAKNTKHLMEEPIDMVIPLTDRKSHIRAKSLHC